MSVQHARGADFSSAQTIAEVEQVAKTIDFAFVKATQGTGYTNPLLHSQASTLRAHGVRVGYYHFLQAGVDGADQWDYFEKAIAALPRGPVVLDYEMAGTTDAQASAFLQRGRQRGFRVGLYAGWTVCKRRLGHRWRWVAYWSSQPPPLRWAVWQFSDGGGKQDYEVFRGDKAELAGWWKLQSHHHAHIRPHKVKKRWWIHDPARHHAIGPMLLAMVGPRLLAYALRHPRSRSYRLERK